MTTRIASRGSVTTRLVEGKIVETVYFGGVSAVMADQVRRDIEPLLRRIPKLEWLINTAAATGFEAAPRESTTGVVALFKKHDGHRIAAVMPSTAIRMIPSALVFATGLPRRIFETREAALQHLRSCGTGRERLPARGATTV